MNLLRSNKVKFSMVAMAAVLILGIVGSAPGGRLRGL